MGRPWRDLEDKVVSIVSIVGLISNPSAEGALILFFDLCFPSSSAVMVGGEGFAFRSLTIHNISLLVCNFIYFL